MLNERSKYIQAPLDLCEKLETDSVLKPLNRWVAQYGNAKDGDCILTEPNPCRNDGKYLWDAKKEKLVEFDCDLDEYGCIPRAFDIRRFPLHYFSHVLDHNDYVRLDNTLIEQIVTQAVYGFPPKTEWESEKRVWSKFFVGEKMYYVMGIPENCLYKEKEIIGETFGEAIVRCSSGEGEKYDVNSLEYAVNFMRTFIDAVRLGQINFRDEDGGTSEDTLFVNC
jgi:hypothetical protein